MDSNVPNWSCGIEVVISNIACIFVARKYLKVHNNNQLYLMRMTHNSISTDKLVAPDPKTINANTITVNMKLPLPLDKVFD